MRIAIAITCTVALSFGRASLTAVEARPPASRTSPQPSPVTFAEHVAPLIFAHCASCHRPGGSAPFSLLTYPEVKGHARQIVAAVTGRTMPPWMPEPGFGEFIGSRQLTDEQRQLIARWFAEGALAGNPRVLPPTPTWKGGWTLGAPDLVVKMPVPYRLAPDGPDRLRNFVVPIPISSRKYVRAWEFRTNNLPVVHHATMMIDPTRSSRQMDEASPEPGYEGLVPFSAAFPDGALLAWTPGQTPQVAPREMTWPLDNDTDLLLMLHLRPSGAWEEVEASVGLYFSDTPPLRTPVMIRLNRQDIDIPPGERRYTITDSYTLPVDVEVYGVQPHAHYLAHEMKALATLPDGTTKWLLYIKNWDFHFQDAYRYVAPLPLPAGTRLSMEYTYDNSPGNRVNPNTPPARVTYGQRTSDEMGDFWIQAVPRHPPDRPLLIDSLAKKLLPQNISGYLTMLRADPDKRWLHDDLALLYFMSGDLANGAKQFAESLRLAPDDPAAHYNVARAHFLSGNWPEAAGHFRRTLEIDPLYGFAADVQASLAWILATSSDVALRNPVEARRLAESAVALSAGQNAVAFDALGVALAALDDFEAASVAILRALALTPPNDPALDGIRARLQLYRRGQRFDSPR